LRERERARARVREREREREKKERERKPISQIRIVARRGLHIANNFETKLGLFSQIKRQTDKQTEREY
jgi:hypothetical protein